MRLEQQRVVKVESWRCYNFVKQMQPRQKTNLPWMATILNTTVETQDVKDLVIPWAHTNRLICADSHFASVETARELYKLGLKFIGVVKTATRSYPWKHLNAIQLHERGDRHGMHHQATEEGLPSLLAFTLLDRTRRYFIASCSNL